ncbi:MAG: hypothetical protein DMG39_12555 [Acidobacteria bacterium]|nr:MAG: hypothetical protein DMG39_12555 [Acidobacteriota bacterium]
MARQFHHVVAAAAFFGVWAKLIGKFAGVGLPAFAVAGAAGAIGALRNDFVPEIIGDVAVAPVAGQFVATGRANDFGDVGVHVQSLEFIFAFRQRIEKFLVIEAPSQRQVLLFSGEGIQIEERLIHPAVLDHLHFGPLLVADGLQVFVHPSGHFLRRGQRLLVATECVHIQVAGQNLVVGVEGRPNALPFF